MIPEADFEKLHGNIPENGFFEAAPRHQQPVVRADVRHSPQKLVKHDALHGVLCGFHLNADFRGAETQTASGGEKVNAVVGAFLAPVDLVSLCAEDCLNYAGKAMPLEIVDEEGGNFVQRFDLQILAWGGVETSGNPAF